MRMTEKDLGERDWATLLARAWDLGVRRLHSSREYESFEFLCAVLARLRDERPDIAFDHVVKLADPSFDDSGFDPARMRASVERYCEALGAERIATVQWMWRKDLKDEPARLAAFEQALPAIGDAGRGLATEFACFPYTIGFAEAAIRSGVFGGLIVYYNIMEREFEAAMDEAAGSGMAVDVIRPFAGGQAGGKTGLPARRLLDDVLARPAVRDAILSVSSTAQLEELAA